jgi:hypothetical protein
MSQPMARGANSVFPGWHTPTNLKWRTVRVPDIGAESFMRGYASPIERLHVLVVWEVGNGWHLSISHPTRYPVWDEIRDARYDLIPDAVTMGMLLPPKSEYVALHPNCFHLHEVTP